MTIQPLLLKITPARREALRALIEPDARRPRRRQGRRSNVTNVKFGYVYWQTADWLVANELAFIDLRRGAEALLLTARGLELAGREGLL